MKLGLPFSNPVHPVTRAEISRHTLALFNWNAVLRLWYDNLAAVTGFVFVQYALALGVRKEDFGYLASVGSLACVVQLAGLLAANAIRDKKRFALFVSYLEPAFFMAMVAAIFFAPPSARAPLIGVGIMLAAAAIHLVKPTMDEWLASAIPSSVRGRFLGRRMQLVSVVSVAAMLVMGYTSEHLRAGALGYGAMLLAGGLFGLLAVQALWGAARPAISERARLSWASAPEVLRCRPFIFFVVATLIYNVPFWLVSPYYHVYHLTQLHLKPQAISLMMAGYFVIKILLLPLAGRLSDRLGARATVYLVSPLYVLFFLLYTLSTPATAWLAFAAWAIIGFAEAGFGVAVTTALYASVPETPARQAFFAFYNLATSLLAAIFAAVSAWSVGKLAGVTLTVGSLRLEQYQILFGISFLILIPCILGTQLYPGKHRKGKTPPGVAAEAS